MHKKSDDWWLDFIRMFLEDMYKEYQTTEDLAKMRDWWELKLDQKGMKLFYD
mgnify:FL=1|tara:strand:- start:729 stop:884 length:156 start_codon:yes stop_codon:yes gene_type:complete